MSWNVNGIRAAERKGFSAWLSEANPSILGLQEVRAKEEQIPPEVLQARGYHVHLSAAEKPGYSGTMLLSKRKPRSVRTELDVSEFDREGRLILAEFDGFAFLNVYFPNGSGPKRENERVPFKLAFYAKLLDEVAALRAAGQGVIIAGDFNTAHRPIDLANPKSNTKTSGFLAEEREELDRWLASGLHDVFRERTGEEPGHYTWWSQRGGARGRNVGWRIDYLLVSEDLVPHVRRSWHEPTVMASDHCPLGIDLVLPRAEAKPEEQA